MSRAAQLGFDALDSTALTHAAEVDRLALVAKGLALEAGLRGITVADVRLVANLPTGRGRQWSFLGAVMRRAGLRRTDEWRRSAIDATHGNLNRVWVLP